MTDVYIVTLSIIGFWVTAPGLAVALNLMLPRVTGRAYRRLTKTPGRSLLAGLIATGLLVLVILILTGAGGGAAQVLALVSGVIGLGVYAIGAAAMSRLLGERIGQATGSHSPIGDTVRGAIVLELASFVPVVGWFILAPLMVFANVGASLFALVGWAPKASHEAKVVDDTPVAMSSAATATGLE